MGRKVIDMTGQRIGKLTVLGMDKTKQSREKYWICQCDCGNVKSIAGTHLRKQDNPTKSCGCARTENNAFRMIDYTGKRIGRLIVLEPTDKRIDDKVVWKCQCDCGNIHYVASNHLQREDVQSCGCLRNDVARENLIKYNSAQSLELLGKRFGRLVATKKLPARSNRGCVIWECRCDCGNIHTVAADQLVAGKVQSCGCINYSIGEKNIAEVLQENNIEFETEKIFLDFIYQDSKAYPRYDFYLPNYNRLIEFDGEQHYKDRETPWMHDTSFQVRRQRDILKNEYALSHNIELVRIPYWERDNITLDMILGNQYLITE